MMMRCKQVAKQLCDNNFHELPWARKMMVRMHVGMCQCCGRFHKDIIKFQQIEHEFDERAVEFCDEKLDETSRENMKKMLLALQNEKS